MPKNVRERDQIWNCPTNPVASGDGRPAAVASPDNGTNLPAPFPGLVTKFLAKGPPYNPDEPLPPDVPPIVPPPEPPPEYPDPPPEFLDGYWEVFNTYEVQIQATPFMDGGHNWEPGSLWSQLDTVEQTVVFSDDFTNATVGQSLAGRNPNFGSGVTGAWA